MYTFLVSLLDDDSGINETAWENLQGVVSDYIALDSSNSAIPKIENLLSKVEECEGRYFLPEDWEE